MKNNFNKIIIIFIIALLITIILNLFLYTSKKNLSSLSLDNYIKIDSINTSLYGVNLIISCNMITMTPTSDQIYSIQRGLENRITSRPLTHDLIKSIFNTFKIEVIMVKIIDYNNGVYFANLILKQGNKILNIDSRPSDAIAIAVRLNKPVYIKEDLLKRGLKFC